MTQQFSFRGIWSWVSQLCPCLSFCVLSAFQPQEEGSEGLFSAVPAPTAGSLQPWQSASDCKTLQG